MGSTELWRRAWRALLAHALFRWESAITIALAIVAIGLFPTPFPFWRWWYWLILFGAAEALIVWSSLTDTQTAERVVADMMRQRYNPQRLRHSHLQSQLEQALQYRQGIEAQVLRARQGVLQDRLRNISSRVDDWMVQISRLAERLDRLSSDRLIQSDAKAIPEAIDVYRSRLAAATDEDVRRQLRQVLASKEAQQAAVEELGRMMERGTLQLDNTVADLGTLYSQFVLLEVRDVDSGRVQRMNEDIDEEINSLADIVQTLDELYRKSAEA